MKKALIVIAVIALAALADARFGPRLGIAGDSASASEPETDSKVGILLPLTGEHAEVGRSMKRGFDMAAELSGASVEYGDTRCNAEYARLSAEVLIDGGVQILVGGVCPDDIGAIASVAAQNGLAYVSAAEPTDSRSSGAVFIRSVDDSPALADYFVAEHVKKYGTAPDAASALAFDALTAVSDIMFESRASVAEVRADLLGVRRVGVSGTVEFYAVPVVAGEE